MQVPVGLDRYVDVMSICRCCRMWGKGSVCDQCFAGLRFAVGTRLSSGLQVSSAYAHQQAARRLVHLLKYQGISAAGEILAAGMEPLLPDDATALVPVPRAVLRKLHYGTDPALVLAKLVARRTGVPVVRILTPRVWWPAHAGSSRSLRRPPGFRLARPAPTGAILIDDVLTTGATLNAAAAATGLDRALTATRAGT